MIEPKNIHNLGRTWWASLWRVQPERAEHVIDRSQGWFSDYKLHHEHQLVPTPVYYTTLDQSAPIKCKNRWLWHNNTDLLAHKNFHCNIEITISSSQGNFHLCLKIPKKMRGRKCNSTFQTGQAKWSCLF